MMLRQKRFVIGGIIIFFAIAYLGYAGFQSSSTYYYTVSELMEQGTSIYHENVRVDGMIASSTVEHKSNGLILRFNLIDGEAGLPVVYQGIVPDAFKVGNEVVVEGYLNSNGIFQAKIILTKCPSKYVPEN